MASEAVTRPDAASSASGSDDPSEMISRAVDEHQRSLLAYAAGLFRGSALANVSAKEAAQDAVQETFLQLCRKAREVAGSDEPPTLAEFAARLAPWLFTVCRNRVIDMQRKRKPQSLAVRERADGSLAEDAETLVMDPGPTPEEAAVAVEEHRRVAQSIGELTPRQREILHLRMQAGLSYREIAEVTGLTTTNVGFHLHQAVASLKKQLVAT